jgi:hypothetical protein
MVTMSREERAVRDAVCFDVHADRENELPFYPNPLSSSSIILSSVTCLLRFPTSKF